MFCESCGCRMPEAARFCPVCGAARESPAPVGRAASEKPHGLGGWLLVLTIALFVGAVMLAVPGIGGLASSLVFQDALSSVLGSQAVGAIIGACAYALACAVAFFFCAVLICRRSERSFLVLQLCGFALIAAAAVLLFLLNAMLMEQGANVIGRSVLSLAAEVAALLLTTLFFCRSARVRAYFGTAAVLDRALFRL